MNLPMTTLLLRALVAAMVFVAWWPMTARPRPSPLPAIAVSVLLIGMLVLHARWRKRHSLRTIRAHAFPAFLRQKLQHAYPQLDEAAARRVERGLRQFFGASAQAQGAFVAMPSKVVDTLWHEFILHTRGYELFCRKAFGRMLHHTPAEALAPGVAPRVNGKSTRHPMQHAGLRRAWYWACRDEGIDPRKPSRLPLLFALDASLGIAGGYVYALDCNLLGADRGGTQCASDLSSGCGGSSDAGSGGCGSGDAGAADAGGSSDDGGGSGGDGGGCGGGGD